MTRLHNARLCKTPSLNTSLSYFLDLSCAGFFIKILTIVVLVWRRTAQKRYRERQVRHWKLKVEYVLLYQQRCCSEIALSSCSVAVHLPVPDRVSCAPPQKEKMHDFERQVELLSKQVDVLMREKANLESRNSLLERVVQLKDEQQQQNNEQNVSKSCASSLESLACLTWLRIENATYLAQVLKKCPCDDTCLYPGWTNPCHVP